MPNLTIHVDEVVLQWVRVRAAERNTSVAHFAGDLLKEQMNASAGYEAALERFMSTRPRKLSQGSYPTRDDLHDRTR